MRTTATIREGIIYYSPEVFDFLAENDGAEVEIQITVINKPEHYLYRYLFGFLIKDISSHSGIGVDEIHAMMKERFAKEHVKSWDEVPKRHRKRCQRYEIVSADGEIVDMYYIKSCGSMTHDELMVYVKNVELHFMDFMEGALNIKTQKEAYELRKKGMMSKEELKKYRGTI